MFRKKKTPATVVGLELDPGHIAAAVASADGSVSLSRGAVSTLRPGVLRDGEASDPVELAAALKTFFAEHDLPTRVRVGIANQRIVARTLELPVMPSDEALEEQVRSVAPDHIPMPIDEAVLDFHALGQVATAEGPRTRVVVVAVRREIVERLHAACDAAGLHVEGIDLAAFGMLRALPRPAASAATLYVGVAGLVNVAVANESGCLFTRAAAGGLEALASSLSDRAGLTMEHAHQWLRHVGLVTELDDVVGEAHLVDATRAALEEGVHELADTVRNSLNFYRMQESAEPVEQGVVTGPALAIPGFVERLSEQLKLPLEPAVVAAEDEAADLSRLTVAAGLAVDGAA